jgi:hypothetical protein
MEKKSYIRIKKLKYYTKIQFFNSYKIFKAFSINLSEIKCPLENK